MTAPSDLRICVIGAGPSGLAAAKNLLQAGFRHFTVYEKNDQVGGNWLYSARPGHSSVYESARTISSKSLSQYEDFPFPENYPPYPSQPELLTYFKNYAAHFGLLNNIRFGTQVQHVKKVSDHRWVVQLDNNVREEFHALFVCNGHHWDPRMPKVPGDFTGRFLHSHDFKSVGEFRRDRVLVMGGGNSAADIAVQVTQASGRCAMSLRRGYHVIPRFLFGVPSDIWYARVASLPLPLIKSMGSLLRLAVSAYTRHGMPKPDHALFECHPVINSQLLYYLRKRRIQITRDVQRFEGREVWFADGSHATFDTVIACTGYRISFPFFDRELIHFDEGIPPLYLRMFHPRHRNLFFVGLVQPNGCIWPISDLQAKIAVNYLAGNYRLPDDLETRANEEAEQIRRSFIRSPRHSLEVHFHQFRRLLLSQVPASAPGWNGAER